MSSDEDQLWKGVMNITTPTGWQSAAFFVIGKMFCLQGGQEYQRLQLLQLKHLEDKYVYHQNVSKTETEASSSLDQEQGCSIVTMC